MSISLKKRPPFDFILEELDGIITAVKPMFGAYGLYRNEQILIILFKRDKHPNDNGIWFGIPSEYVEEIRKEIPQLHNLQLFGSGLTAWQVLRESDEQFEEVATHMCELIRKKDKRIGRTPKAKLKKAKKKVRKKVIKKKR